MILILQLLGLEIYLHKRHLSHLDSRADELGLAQSERETFIGVNYDEYKKHDLVRMAVRDVHRRGRPLD